jgi:hypothetical protein
MAERQNVENQVVALTHVPTYIWSCRLLIVRHFVGIGHFNIFAFGQKFAVPVPLKNVRRVCRVTIYR